ncbi:MAG: hypothetical protein LBK75_00990 [Oscillospiraceae bacterium]|nr:hypothetical protein [Oscillospiraceae bacterium]
MRRIMIVGVLMATLMSALYGCDAVDKKATEPILTALAAKYGQSFTVYALGDRIGRDTATAYVFSDDDPTLLFTARVSREGTLTFENYAYRKLCRKIENITSDIFAQYGFKASCYATLFGTSADDVTQVEIDLQDYLNETKPEAVSLSIAIEEHELVIATLEQVYGEIYAELQHTTVGSTLHVLSEADYEAVNQQIQLETQLFDASRLKMFGASGDIREIQLKYDADGLTSTTDDRFETIENKAHGL